MATGRRCLPRTRTADVRLEAARTGDSVRAASVSQGLCVHQASSPKEGFLLDHLSIGVSDLTRSRLFYDAALRPLGLTRILDFGHRGSDYGATAGPTGVEFTITVEEGQLTAPGVHACFRAAGRDAVNSFYQAALAHGGHGDGAPGLRPNYHPDYYGAFVRDPDGHRIEAVCHEPPACPASQAPTSS